tara:strand:- start:47 stop:1651 length:1605 start_codon:yes stop_codon:yes gene_type:complete
MPELILPNAAETVELGSELIRERIFERIDELEAERTELGKGVAADVGKGKKLKTVNLKLYQALSKIRGQLKSLRRGAGGLLTMDPDAIVNPATKETWGMLVKELVDKNLTGQALADRLKKFGAFVDTNSPVFRGRVGHHRTALGILREVLKDKPFEFRTKFKDLARRAGYMIGEEFIDFIDPASHNYFSTNVQGVLLKKLGITKKNQLPPSLVEALADRYAHALRFGSGAGVDVPTDFLKADVNVDSLFSFARPYLEGARRGAESALEIDEVIRKGVWETPEELTRLINKIKIRDTSDLLDARGRPIFKQDKTSIVSKASALEPNQILLTEGVDPSDVSDDWLKKNHLFRNTLKPIFQKINPKNITRAGVVKTVTSATKAAARPTLEVADTVFPSRTVVETFEEEGAGEGFKVYRKELFDRGAVLGTTMGLMKAASYIPLVKGAVTTTGGVLSNPFIGVPLLAGSLAHQFDESFLEGKGKQFFRDAKKGEFHTTTATDDTVVGSIKRNRQGVNVVKDKETGEYYEYSIPNIKHF